MQTITNLCKVLSALLFVVLLVLALLLAAPHVVGLKTYVVLSASMEPSIPVGAMVYVKPATPEEIQPNDVITFTFTDNLMATHRVLSIDQENQTFLTKGDNNDTEDGDTAFDRLVGKVVWSVPLIGYLAAKLQSSAGIPIVAALLIVLVVVSFLPDILNKGNPGDPVPAAPGAGGMPGMMPQGGYMMQNGQMVQMPPGYMMQNGQMVPMMDPNLQAQMMQGGYIMQNGQMIPVMGQPMAQPPAGDMGQQQPAMPGQGASMQAQTPMAQQPAAASAAPFPGAQPIVQQPQAMPGMQPTMPMAQPSMQAAPRTGNKKVKMCPRCNAENKAKAKWCTSCGITLPK